MTEFKTGIFKFFQTIILKDSISLAIVYTVGHVIIASLVAYFITGATLELAALDAIIEPIINGFWFYILHKFWVSKNHENS
jgi:uncharacterized membrane protein